MVPKKLLRLIRAIPEKDYGVLVDLFRKLAGPDGHLWIKELKAFIRKDSSWGKEGRELKFRISERGNYARRR